MHFTTPAPPPHPIGELAGATRIELTVEEAANLRGLGVELLCQDLHRVALSGQPGLEIVKIGRQGDGDDVGRNRLLTHTESGLEGTIMEPRPVGGAILRYGFALCRLAMAAAVFLRVTKPA